MSNADRFRDAVTSSTFSLTLGRGMIRCLFEISLGRRSEFRPVLYPQWCVSLRALYNRGLIEAQDLMGGMYDSPFVESYRLTEAGRLTLRLCEIAGLVPKPDPTPRQEVSHESRS